MAQTHCPPAWQSGYCEECGHHEDKLPVKHHVLLQIGLVNMFRKGKYGHVSVFESLKRVQSCWLALIGQVVEVLVYYFVTASECYIYIAAVTVYTTGLYKTSLRLETRKLWEMLLMSSFRPTYRPDSHRVTQGTSAMCWFDTHVAGQAAA